MTNQEKWPIGMIVKFNHDGLKARGIIIVHENSDYSVIVCLEDTLEKGWEINSYQCPSRPDCFGKKGWHVPYPKLEKCITKLGNIL